MKWLETILGDAYTEEIGKSISSEVGKRFVAREDFNTVNEAKKQLDLQVKERDKQLSDLQKTAGNGTELQTQLEKLQEANAQMQKEHDEKLRELRLNSAVEKALLESKAKNLTATKALLADFLSSAEVDDKGNVSGLAEAVKGICDSEETGFLFEKSSEPKISGAAPANPDKVHPTGDESYEARLLKARKDNDNLAAIQIKREAAENDVYLN